VLHDISCSIPVGRLTAVVGEVGAGKSSVLSALLGELRLTQGRAAVDAGELFGPGGVGYVGQAPWVLGGTIRENVLMGEPYDPEWLQQVRGRGRLFAACSQHHLRVVRAVCAAAWHAANSWFCPGCFAD
jgi:ABC-type transport system involved in cytochrome bd biosynthesis fused ATPase/permease subunit